jgi:hypothetical protein
MAQGETRAGAGLAVDAALPTALMTLTMHMLESRVALVSRLSRCGTVTEANDVMLRWLETRLSEYTDDQARVMQAMLQGVSQAASAATDAMTTANGLAKAGLDATANGRGNAA